MHSRVSITAARDGSRVIFFLLAFIFCAPVFCHGDSKPEIVQRLERTRVLHIKWPRGASAQEVISFVDVRFRELETDRDESRRGISFIQEFDGNPKAGPWFSGEGVAFTVVLQQIANSFGLDVHVTSIVVVIKSAGVPAFPNSKAESGHVYRTFTGSSE